MKSNEAKSKQLGMPIGTAFNRLRKMILFSLLEQHGKNFCHRCNRLIERVDELSVEHKLPWLHEDTTRFWDLNNIGFSHLKCNISHKRSGKKSIEQVGHGGDPGYSRGCRCDKCKKANYERIKKYRASKKSEGLKRKS